MTLLSASCGSAAAHGGKPMAYRRIKNNFGGYASSSLNQAEAEPQESF